MDVNIEVSNRFASFLTDWDYEQYLLLGGYGSGKSYHAALKIILKLLEEKRTALVVRQVRETIKDSCFALFKEILEKMGLLSDEAVRNNHRPKGTKWLRFLVLWKSVFRMVQESYSEEWIIRRKSSPFMVSALFGWKSVVKSVMKHIPSC